MYVRKISAATLICVLACQPSFANNVGENVAWQFDMANDQAVKLQMEEVRQRRLNGYYSAPIYNTYIEDQYNCAVNSTATGNDSTSDAIANSPSTSGHNTNSTGNANDTSYSGGGLGDGSSESTSQDNQGNVSAGASGSMSTDVRGDNFQALNTDQNNSGNQSAAINGSSACQFAAG